jgi:hypothetical protein
MALDRGAFSIGRLGPNAGPAFCGPGGTMIMTRLTPAARKSNKNEVMHNFSLNWDKSWKRPGKEKGRTPHKGQRNG